MPTFPEKTLIFYFIIFHLPTTYILLTIYLPARSTVTRASLRSFNRRLLFSWPIVQNCCLDKVPESDYIKGRDSFGKTANEGTTTSCQEDAGGPARSSRRSKDSFCTWRKIVLVSWRGSWSTQREYGLGKRLFPRKTLPLGSTDWTSTSLNHLRPLGDLVWQANGKDMWILGSAWVVFKGIHRDVHCSRESLYGPAGYCLGDPVSASLTPSRKALSMPQSPWGPGSGKVPVTCHAATPFLHPATSLGSPCSSKARFPWGIYLAFCCLPGDFLCLLGPFSVSTCFTPLSFPLANLS